MGALEYLTANSLISYPFKYSKSVNFSSDNAIKQNWFYDILFVSKSTSIRSVYISRIRKESGSLYITFNNSEILDPSDSLLDTVQITSENLIDHRANQTTSFISFSKELFYVKLVLGAGLVDKSDFDQTYTSDESELQGSAVILKSPRLDNLTLSRYITSLDESLNKVYSVETVGIFSADTDAPEVKSRYNTEFSQIGVNSVALDLNRGLGAGVYDPCPQIGQIQDVYSVFDISPNSSGHLFLNVSSCYTANTLTNNDVALYASYNPSPLSVYPEEIIIPNHSILFQNFCSPKCPRENINAFAHYLNRVTDGAVELNSIAYRQIETRGVGSCSIEAPRNFTASVFVDNEEFSRCAEHTSGVDIHIGIGNKFIKNYHEFRTLQLYYGIEDIREYTILKVLSDNEVILNTEVQNPETLRSFKIIDNGVFSDMNCAIYNANLTAQVGREPYFKVKYTTTEAYNPQGIYSTYYNVVVGVYNPSNQNNIQLNVNFNYSSSLIKQGQYKIRKKDTTTLSDTATVTLNCREYALIEAVYYVPADSQGNIIEVSVQDLEQGVTIGSTYQINNVVGQPTPTVVTSGNLKHRILKDAAENFSAILNINTVVTAVSFYGDIPAWLNKSFSNFTHQITLDGAYNPTDTLNKRYLIYFRSFGGNVTDIISSIVIDYVAPPVINFPSNSSYPSNSPLAISKSIVYTTNNPIFSTTATNMLNLSPDIPTDPLDYRYNLTTEISEFPPGLNFDIISGQLTGTVPAEILVGTSFSATLKAINPAGQSDEQLLYFIITD